MARLSKYSSLHGKCICCNSESSEYIDNILLKAIESFTHMHSQKGMVPLPKEELLEYIKTNLLILLIDDKYVVGLSIFRTWFSSETYLAEDFLFCYGEGTATLQDVVDGMVYVGRRLGCDKIEVGTLAANNPLRHKALASAYEKSGFAVNAVTLTRSI